MKTMCLTGIGQMEIMERPMPAIINETDVLIRMKAVGVCGSDIHYYTSGKIGSQVVNYPFPVGHEGAGEVAAVGKGVKWLKVGQRVAIEPAMPCYQCDQCRQGRRHTCRNMRFLGCPGQADGCLSEYIVMPEANCLPIPASMSYDDAAISEPLSIGIYSVRLSHTDMKNRSVGILGFGPIGMSVMLSALQKEAGRIYVTDKIDERLAVANACGAAWTGNPAKTDVVSLISDQEPGLLDVVYECCGRQEAVNQAVELLKPGGKLLIIGIPEFGRWSFPVDQLRHKEICIQNVRRQNDAVHEAIDLLAQKKVDVGNMLTHRFGFEHTKEAFDLVAAYADGVMKAMIDFDFSY